MLIPKQHIYTRITIQKLILNLSDVNSFKLTCSLISQIYIYIHKNINVV
jgi:hypothetical protein